jgi:hypothetical protein
MNLAPDFNDFLKCGVLYSHPSLIDINWFQETLSISDSSVNVPNFSICFVFHRRAHNFTNFFKTLQNVMNGEHW